MAQPKKSARVPRNPAADLAPAFAAMVRSETQKALAGLGEAIAEQVRAQIVAALTPPATTLAVARKPVAAKLATAAKTAKPTKVAKRGGAKAGAAQRPAGTTAEAGCNVKGCTRPHRSKGYCAAHYQSARKHGWPTPCPAGFEAPAAKRGRPAKADGKTQVAAAM